MFILKLLYFLIEMLLHGFIMIVLYMEFVIREYYDTFSLKK